MTTTHQSKTHWAVLIGSGITIERVSDGKHETIRDRSVPGAVQDVIAMETFLKNQVRSAKLDLTSLKASKATPPKGSTAKVSDAPVEDPSIWPTFENVVASLKRIIQTAKPGECVFVHYSGHGVRRHDDGAVALVLYDPGPRGVRYLSATQLRQAMRGMVNKGLFVTLVLDCCFSGSVLQLDRALNPDGYTVISACGPHETANEIRLEDGMRRGALSYFLTDSLTLLQRRNSKITHRSLHQHLRARFNARYHRQMPMLYGNKDLEFFESSTPISDVHMVSVFRDIADGRLLLDAGQAHGVHKGDEYAIYPPHVEERSVAIAKERHILAKVTAVGCLFSELRASNPTEDALIRKGSAWKSRLISSLSPQKIRIRIPPGLVLPASDNPFLHLSATDTPASPSRYVVSLNAGRTAFEIRDTKTSKPLPSLSPIPLSHSPTDPSTASTSHLHLLNTLSHLARFKYFESVQNTLPSPAFERTFTLTPSTSPSPSGVHHITHGSAFTLHFENLSPVPLYLALFLFKGHTYEVCDLVSDAGQDATIAVPPRARTEAQRMATPYDPDLEDGTAELAVEMSVPEGARVREDVVKVFVMNRGTVFPGVVLPPLVGGGGRGGEEGLGRLGDGEKGGVGVQRGAGELKGAWTCRSFVVRTSV
ncbi:hypothetical protein QBC39DRAFT_312369 [Podospora conica]|nr:hypothetical protein QBC39DRAFT_312369 [Schizothecium conicum]